MGLRAWGLRLKASGNGFVALRRRMWRLGFHTRKLSFVVAWVAQFAAMMRTETITATGPKNETATQ